MPSTPFPSTGSTASKAAWLLLQPEYRLVLSLLWPSPTTTSSELGLLAFLVAATTSCQSINISGTSGNSTRVTPAIKPAVSAASGSCGSGTIVDLSSVFNVSGIKTDGTSFGDGGLDGDGSGLSDSQLNTARVLNGTRFAFGKADTLDAVYGTGQAIALPVGNFVTLQLMATGINGA